MTSCSARVDNPQSKALLMSEVGSYRGKKKSALKGEHHGAHQPVPTRAMGIWRLSARGGPRGLSVCRADGCHRPRRMCRGILRLRRDSQLARRRRLSRHPPQRQVARQGREGSLVVCRPERPGRCDVCGADLEVGGLLRPQLHRGLPGHDHHHDHHATTPHHPRTTAALRHGRDRPSPSTGSTRVAIM